MKKLTKISKILLLVVAALTMTQCRKAIEPVYQIPNNNGEKVLFTLTADNGSKGTRTEIEQAGNILNVTWSAGDVIYVAGSVQGYLGSLTLRSGDGTGTATFSGEITSISGTQNIHVYYLGKTPRTISGDATTIDIGTQAGTLDDIEDYHIASATIASVPAGTTDLSATLVTKLAIVKVDLTGFGEGTKLFGSVISKTLTLDLKSGGLTGDNSATNYSTGISVSIPTLTNSTYIALLPGNDVTMIFECPTLGISTSAAFTNKDLEANTFYSLTDAGNGMVPPPVGVVDGLFTVNSEGKQVYFSKGNLQFIAGNVTDATGRKWQFADEQWSALGFDDGNTVVNGREFQSVPIDLFGWGTSGIHTTNTYNKPWDILALSEYDEYTGESNDVIGFGYGPLYDGLLVDLTIINLADWGCNNIDVEGVITNEWRTLSASEWTFLINERTDAPSKKGLARIVYDTYNPEEPNPELVISSCLVLLPDSFDAPVGFNTICDDFDNNIIKFTEAQNLTDSGVVFLPDTGYRIVYEGGENITITDFGLGGFYWTSSVYTEGSDNIGASYFSFDEGVGVGVNLGVENGETDPAQGLAVRLVKNYN